MKNENKAMMVVAAYILIMLIVSLVAISTVKKNATEDIIPEKNLETDMQIVYIPIYKTTEEYESDEAEPIEKTYILKEYQGKIGIYSDGGVLIDVLEVYIKLLPETDRNLLGEGIKVSGEAELHALIEDYMG